MTSRPPISASTATRLALPALVVSLLLSTTLLQVYAPYVEGIDYSKMAAGDATDVYFYYAGRIAHPTLVGIVKDVTGMSLTDSFRLVALASVFFFCYSVLLLIGVTNIATSYYTAFVLFFTATLARAVHDYYFHDLFFNLVVALALLAYRRSMVALSLILGLSILTRDVGLVLALVFLGLEVWARRWRTALAIAMISLAALSYTTRLTSRATPNKHGIGLLTNYALKVPYNLLRDVTGVTLWTDTNADTTSCALVWETRLSETFQVGNIRSVGLCEWDPQVPVHTLVLYLSLFGLTPIVWFRPGAISQVGLLCRREPEVCVALIFGSLNALLALVIGTATERYLLYAWPLWWFAGYRLVAQQATLRSGIRRQGYEWAGAHMLLSWLPALPALLPGRSGLGLAVAMGAMGIWTLAWRNRERLQTGAWLGI